MFITLLLVFGLYLVLLAVLRVWRPAPSRRSMLYASGEAHPSSVASPQLGALLSLGLCFVALHVGVLLLAFGTPVSTGTAYLLGLALLPLLLRPLLETRREDR